jgi:hypothetical protein
MGSAHCDVRPGKYWNVLIYWNLHGVNRKKQKGIRVIEKIVCPSSRMSVAQREKWWIMFEELLEKFGVDRFDRHV